MKNPILSRLRPVRPKIGTGWLPVGKVDGDGHLESSDQLKGKVIKPKSTITYVYKEVKGDIYVHYKDTDGNTIKWCWWKRSLVDKDYDTVIDTVQKEINTTVRHMGGNYNVGKLTNKIHLVIPNATTGKKLSKDVDVHLHLQTQEQPTTKVMSTYTMLSVNGNKD